MRLSEVLCSLTTQRFSHSWQAKIQEIKDLGLTRFSLFLTGVRAGEREYLFEKLETLQRSHKFEIPFVHATSDMHNDEYKKLIDTFGTELFNLHPVRCYPLKNNLEHAIRQKIHIENSTPTGELFAADIEGFGGLCLDLSHCEDARFYNAAAFEAVSSLVEQFPIGANHLSSVLPTAHTITQGRPVRSTHVFGGLPTYDYIRKYNRNFWGRYMAIELNDPFSTQLVVKAYIERLLTEQTSNQDCPQIETVAA